MKRIIVATLMALAGTSAFALETGPGVKITPLLRTETTWDGQRIVYPAGPPQVTAMTIEIAPGAETGWHVHPVPSFGFVLEGSLEVVLKDGRKKRFEQGQAIPEVVDTTHNGRNVGTKPLKLLVVYAGTVEKPISIKDDMVKADEKAPAKAEPDKAKPDKKTP